MIDVVITTISDGSFLKTWEQLIRQAGRQGYVRLIIIPDTNTPASLHDHVHAARKAGITVLCPTPDDQAAFLANLGCQDDFIPWRSDNRRNVGYLMSLRDGAEAVISVDDDNLPVAETWFGTHEVVTQPPSVQLAASTASGWLNTLSMMETRPSRVWPRGFPYFARETSPVRGSCKTVDIAINMGMVLGDPDVDAITRLGAHPEALAKGSPSLVLARDTWTPVNSQNTAVRRDVLPAYWFARMPVWGGRMGDIFQGYFAQACAKHLGHSVRVGTPLVKQDRNDHDLLHDLELEFPFLRLLDRLLEWLPEQKLEGSTYRDAYESLSHALDGLKPVYFHQLADDMRSWLKLCDTIG